MSTGSILKQALRLTRAGRLGEATAVLRDALPGAMPGGSMPDAGAGRGQPAGNWPAGTRRVHPGPTPRGPRRGPAMASARRRAASPPTSPAAPTASGATNCTCRNPTGARRCRSW